MTLAGAQTIAMTSTSATQQSIAFGGKSLIGTLQFQGVGSSYQLQDALVSAGSLVLASGTLDTNGQSVTCDLFSSTLNAARTLTAGTTLFTFTSNGCWVASGLNATYNVSSSTIACTNGTTTFAGGGSTFGTVTSISQNVTITGANTFGALTLTGAAIATGTVTLGADQTITGTLTINGNSPINRLLVLSDVVGTQRMITAANVVTQNTDWQDINGTGAANWDLHAITGLSGDCQGNAGITFTAPTTQTATGTASFSWNLHGWTTHVPLPQDTAVIPNAFVAGRMITVNMPRPAKDIVFTCTGSPLLSVSQASTIYGSLSMATGMSTNTSQTLTLAGRGTHTITSNTAVISLNTIINSFNGTYSLGDNYQASASGGIVTLTSGAFVTAGKNVLTSSFQSTGALARSMVVGFGTTWSLYLNVASNAWNVAGSNYSIIAHASSTIKITTATTAARTFIGGGGTYGVLDYTLAGSTGSLTITGSNTFNTINFSDASNARSLLFTAATTTTVDTLNVQGTAGKLMTIDTPTAAVHTLTKPSGVVSCDYMSVKNSIAIGGAKWIAGGNSTNVSGNTGWKFPRLAVAAGGNWSSTSTWVGGVVPTASSDVWLASTSGAVTINAAAVCRSLDCTGYVSTLTHNAFTLSIGDATTSVLGDELKLSAGMTYTLASSTTSAIAFVTSAGGGAITTAGRTLGDVSFAGAAGVADWYLADDLLMTGTLTVTSGDQLNCNNHNVTTLAFTNAGSSMGVYLGTGTWLLTGLSGTVWNPTGSGPMSAANATIVFGVSSSGRTFVGQSKSYGALTYVVAGSTGSLAITGFNSFGTINFSDASNARTLTLPAGGTTTVSTTFNAQGSAGKLMSVVSSSSGTPATLSKAGAAVNCDYLSLKDSAATGGASWYAGANSTNVSGNTGWTFSAAPVIVTKAQAAISRIAITETKAQAAVSRIAVVATKIQASIARIAQAISKTQAAVARIAATGSKAQTSISRVALTIDAAQSALARVAVVRSKAQSSVARIAAALSKDQSATSRIAVDETATQAGIASIATTATITQPVVSRIEVFATLAQPAVSSIAATGLTTQQAIAAIKAALSATQTATAQILPDGFGLAAQDATARVAIERTAIQTATAHVLAAINLVQTAIARIEAEGTAAQSATAFIDMDNATLQLAVARIAVDGSVEQQALAAIEAVSVATQSATALIVPVSHRTQTAVASISSVGVNVGATLDVDVSARIVLDAKVSKSIAWTVKVEQP
jgi:hypothetical protein